MARLCCLHCPPQALDQAVKVFGNLRTVSSNRLVRQLIKLYERGGCGSGCGVWDLTPASLTTCLGRVGSTSCPAVLLLPCRASLALQAWRMWRSYWRTVVCGVWLDGLPMPWRPRVNSYRWMWMPMPSRSPPRRRVHWCRSTPRLPPQTSAAFTWTLHFACGGYSDSCRLWEGRSRR